jgi:hypothetical protein
VKRRDRYAPVRESGFHRRGASGAPPRRQQRSSVHPTHPGQRPSSAVKTIRSGEGAQGNGSPSTRGAADRRFTGCLAGIGRVSLAQPGYAAGLVCHEGPWPRVPAVSPIPVMWAVPGRTAYRLLVRGELLWPGRCSAGRSRPPPGGARTCPARCDHKASSVSVEAGAPCAATAVRNAVTTAGPVTRWCAVRDSTYREWSSSQVKISVPAPPARGSG